MGNIFLSNHYSGVNKSSSKVRLGFRRDKIDFEVGFFWLTFKPYDVYVKGYSRINRNTTRSGRGFCIENYVYV